MLTLKFYHTISYFRPMDVCIQVNGVEFQLSSAPVDLAIPMIFNGTQPNSYGVPEASSKAYEGKGFIGDVRRGGSCNFEEYRVIPHCNGTHTEGVGHITDARIPVHHALRESWVLASLISVSPETGATCLDHYRPPLNPEDLVITRSALEKSLPPDPTWMEALIIRTLPNDPEKASRDYLAVQPPFFSLEAMQWIRSRGVRHLLVDLPSVDRMFDDGHLDNHHAFWSVPADTHDSPSAEAMKRTITEMIFVPDDVQDGRYVLELQIAAWMTDAAPSRPRIYALL